MTKLEQFIQQLSERTELSESSYGTFAKITRLELKMVVEMLKVAIDCLEHHEGYKPVDVCLDELNRLAEGVVGNGLD